jgi:hypothetical protein
MFLFIVTAIVMPGCWWQLWRLPHPDQPATKPFTSTYQQVHQDNSQRSQFIVTSDGQGHVRTDDGSDTFNLYDYVRQDMYAANKSHRVYIDTRRITPGITSGFGGYVLFDEKSIQHPPLTFFLGNETIDGKTCRHYSGFLFFPEDRFESWYCPELNCCKKHSLISSGFLGHYVLTLTSYNTAKPDPKLFDLTGYRLVAYDVYRNLVGH